LLWIVNLYTTHTGNNSIIGRHSPAADQNDFCRIIDSTDSLKTNGD
jgi:hypothetical protein